MLREGVGSPTVVASPASERKPLWQLICDLTPDEFVKATAFSYITDAFTPAKALALLKSKPAGKAERLERVNQGDFPSYTTSVGWFGYSDEKITRLAWCVHRFLSYAPSDQPGPCSEAIAGGFNRFRVNVKVGADVAVDARRLKLVQSLIDDPEECVTLIVLT